MRSVGAIVVVCMIGGCTSGGSEAAERRTDTTGRRDSIAAAAAAAMTEAQVIATLQHTHAADSALGALGAVNGSVNEIKDFGRMILREHHALNSDIAGIARDAAIGSEALRVPPDEPPSATRQNLDATDRGSGWDRAYVDYSVAVHESAMENTARALAATKREEVKTFIRKSVPILQKHIDKAHSLQRAMSKAPAAAPAKTAKPAKP